jgi:hypothetical protein
MECAEACDHCAASCLRETNVELMTLCIELDLECSSLCKTAALSMQLESQHANRVCELCADVCNACADECEKHDNDHCQACAAACRRCAEMCASMAAA